MAVTRRAPQGLAQREVREFQRLMAAAGYTLAPGGDIDGSKIAAASVSLDKVDQIDGADPGGDNGIMVCNDGNEYEMASTTGVADYKVPQIQTDKTIDYAWPIANGTPASASATGEAGQMLWDSDYLYVCVATDTWKRAPLGSW